jgi:transcriptional regulator with XRE-family HTH domain
VSAQETFGQRVRRLRDTRKWSQAWVAEQLGLQDRVTVWLWEHDRNVPTNKHMQQLAELLGVSEMYLRFGEPAAPPDERQLSFAQAGKP